MDFATASASVNLGVPPLDLGPYDRLLERLEPMPWLGSVTQVTGLLLESVGPSVAINDFIEIKTAAGRAVRAQVVGFRNGRVLSMPLEEIDGVQLGDPVTARKEAAGVWVGPQLLGRVLDGFGLPLDGETVDAEALYPLYALPPGPLEREPITARMATGIRAIDALLPCAQGQRVGIFGGSGVGKSTLLGEMCRHSAADVVVVALVGERNREVRDFVERELGPEGRKRSVVVAATSDRPAPVRIRASLVSFAVAEYFRDQGANVLLIVDSVTRLAMAQREIGLASGEPPSQKGYTPSVFALLPKLLERAGRFRKGSITGFFTVLVEGDDFNEPICDAVRGILDGHIVLSRQLAHAGHYPAIDVLQSVSRLGSRVSTPEELQMAATIREAMATYHHAADLIQLGAHVAGANPKLDRSIQAQDAIRGFLTQRAGENPTAAQTLQRMREIAAQLSA